MLVFNPKVTIPGIRVDGGSNIAGDYFLSATKVMGKNYYMQKTGTHMKKLLAIIVLQAVGHSI